MHLNPVPVIVNADDLGLSPEVNEATFDLIAAGRLTSATILANGLAVAEAVQRARHFRTCSFGIHLNLTEFEPLTAARQSAPLVVAGQLSLRTIPAAPTPRFLHAAFGELCAQVERLLKLGLCISHIDSHHHVHTVPSVFPVVKAVQHRYGIGKIRISKNIYVPCTVSRALLWKKAAYNWTLRHVYNCATTEGFSEFASFHTVGTRVILPHRSIEAMVHPGAAANTDETALVASS